MATLTSANSVIILAVPSLLGATQLQGFAADDIYDSVAMVNKEILMGLDGIMGVSWIPVPFSQTYMLQANSISIPFFDSIWSSEQQIRDAYQIQGIITLPGLQRTFTLKNGTLMDYVPLPKAAKVLQPRAFHVMWESVNIAAV